MAQVGNDTSAYQTSGAFVSQTPFNSEPTFSNQDFIPNSNLKPERTTSYEFGTDLHFLDNRLRIDFTYYNANTEDQIISLPVAISSGYSQQVVNGGKVNTQGIEIILGVTPIQTDNFNWNATLSFEANHSVTKMCSI